MNHPLTAHFGITDKAILVGTSLTHPQFTIRRDALSVTVEGRPRTSWTRLEDSGSGKLRFVGPEAGQEIHVEAEELPGKTRLRFRLLGAKGSIPADWSLGIALEEELSWYGVGTLDRQQWPLNVGGNEIRRDPLATADPFCLVTTPLWLNSRGGGLAFTQYYDMAFSLNRCGDGLLQLEVRGVNEWECFVLSGSTIVEAWRTAVELYGRPQTCPPADLFTQPIWTTWVAHKTDVTQEKVETFAKEIRGHRFPGAVIEIDDRWQSAYGDTEFDPVKFPAPGRMVQTLHDQGFQTTCWTMPFIDLPSAHYQEARDRGYLLKKRRLNFVTNEVDFPPVVFDWWQGRGSHLDFSNPEAARWYVANLKALQEKYGLAGFKFDAGEVNFTRGMLADRPIPGSGLTDAYTKTVGSLFAYSEVRSGCFNQPNPCFIRQMDKFSTWGLDNGLHSVLTQALTLGLLGYPFVLPDMVGGNQYGNTCDAELFSRWMELNAFLPSLQLSITPWSYDPDTENRARAYCELHEVAGRVLHQSALEYLKGGLPPVMPLFFLNPEDPRTYQIDDQFIAAGRVLVAPILKPGATQRTVYLPAGQWTDPWTNETWTGPCTVATLAPLGRLPFFLLGGATPIEGLEDWVRENRR